jgi:acyl dehydratase
MTAPDAAGRITDEAVAELRRRIGQPEPHPVPPQYRRPNADAFRNVARAYGDDNPLWCDEAAAQRSYWLGLIASPVLVGGDSLIGEDELTAAERAAHEGMRGDPLRGVHAFYAASEREWWGPLRPDLRVQRRNALVGVLDKGSEFAGRAIHEWTAQVFADETGSLLGGQYRLMIRAERRKAREKGKYSAVEVEPYTDEQIDEIDAAYDAYERRGARPRHYEDVQVGDELPRMVKGPLTVTDMICWHVGMGMGRYGIGPLELARRNRRRVPRFYHRDEFNVPDVLQRVHWDSAFAKKAGNPHVYDYGRMRETWMIQLCTDWMGDEAWLWHLRAEFRKFNYVGDTQWVTGRVVGKHVVEAGQGSVEVELTATNQRGEVTTTGTAKIILPQQGEQFHLPSPPGGAATLPDALTAIAERFAEA